MYVYICISSHSNWWKIISWMWRAWRKFQRWGPRKRRSLGLYASKHNMRISSKLHMWRSDPKNCSKVSDKWIAIVILLSPKWILEWNMEGQIQIAPANTFKTQLLLESPPQKVRWHLHSEPISLPASQNETSNIVDSNRTQSLKTTIHNVPLWGNRHVSPVFSCWGVGHGVGRNYKTRTEGVGRSLFEELWNEHCGAGSESSWTVFLVVAWGAEKGTPTVQKVWKSTPLSNFLSFSLLSYSSSQRSLIVHGTSH